MEINSENVSPGLEYYKHFEGMLEAAPQGKRSVVGCRWQDRVLFFV